MEMDLSCLKRASGIPFIGFRLNVDTLALATKWRSLRPPQLLAASANVLLSAMAQNVIDATAMVRRGAQHWDGHLHHQEGQRRCMRRPRSQSSDEPRSLISMAVEEVDFSMSDVGVVEGRCADRGMQDGYIGVCRRLHHRD